VTEDQTTTLLHDRLHRLADDLAPQLDVVDQVRRARAGHSRTRRGRLLFLAVATAAAAVAVPLSIAASNASGPDGGVAGPGGSQSTAVPTPTISAEDAARRMAELAAARAEARARTREAAQEKLATDVAALKATFAARATPLSLTAPTGKWSCPSDKGGAMSAALGIGLDYGVRTLPGDQGCAWRSGVELANLADSFTLGIGFDVRLTERDLRDGFLFTDGCEQTDLPGSAPAAVLEVCLDEEDDSLMLYVPDSSGTGVWTFASVVGRNQPVNPATAMAAVVDVADRTW
jgi:hypothetical protein